MADDEHGRVSGAEFADALRASPPFDALGSEQLARVAAATRRQPFEAGTGILQEGRGPSPALYVVRGGSVRVRDDDRSLDEPGPGEVFGELSLLSGSGPTATVVAGDGLVCLVVDGEVAREVLGTAGGVAFVQ